MLAVDSNLVSIEIPSKMIKVNPAVLKLRVATLLRVAKSPKGVANLKKYETNKPKIEVLTCYF
jgi:hypothetical protein